MSYNSINLNKKAIGKIDDAIDNYSDASREIKANNDNPSINVIIDSISLNIKKLEDMKISIKNLNRRIEDDMYDLEKKRAQQNNNASE